MNKPRLLRRVAGGAVLLLVSAVLPARHAQAQLQQNVPAALSRVVDRGPVRQDTVLTLTVRLKMPNRAAFDQAVEALYDPASPTYQHWMSDADLARYAPGAAQIKTVEAELVKHGLHVLSVDPLGFSIRVQGTAAQVESAFQTQLHEFSWKGKLFQAHVSDARLTGPGAALVASVSGLERHTAQPMLKRVSDPHSGLPPAPVPLARAEASLSSIITDMCLTGPQTFTYTTPKASLPVGVYYGNVYDKSGLVCTYTAAQLQAHYGLPAAYKQGLNGEGQSVVLVEAYGYPTMLEDANAFAKLMGLPPLDPAHFAVVYPQGKPKNPNLGVLTGWDVEIALDIDSAHSLAPGAKIVVVATNGQDNEDFQNSVEYVANHHLGNSVSNSWETDLDLIAGPMEQQSFNDVLELAVAKGISVQFSTGDGGDDGLGTPLGAPGVPSVAPYATAVGGTSILNTVGGSGQQELGWGTLITYLQLSDAVLDPPVPIGFFGGSGGGESTYWPKPSWQKSLPGSGRQTPDVAALADPYTGASIVITSNGTQYFEPGWGGTSLACPLVSAIWAIANQEAGHPLGQAARKAATLSSPAILDVLPLKSPTDPAGTIFDKNGATYYSPTALFSGLLYSQMDFTSAIWPLDAADAVDLSFGTDSSLTVTRGWDNVTGFGSPNGLAFIKAAAGK